MLVEFRLRKSMFRRFMQGLLAGTKRTAPIAPAGRKVEAGNPRRGEKIIGSGQHVRERRSGLPRKTAQAAIEQFAANLLEVMSLPAGHRICPASKRPYTRDRHAGRRIGMDEHRRP